MKMKTKKEELQYIYGFNELTDDDRMILTVAIKIIIALYGTRTNEE